MNSFPVQGDLKTNKKTGVGLCEKCEKNRKDLIYALLISKPMILKKDIVYFHVKSY